MNDVEIRDSEIEHSIVLEGSVISRSGQPRRGQPDRQEREDLPLAGEAVGVPLHAGRQFGSRHPMVEVLVTGGAGFIGSNFVRYALGHASRLARHDARQADLRGPDREPARRHGPPAPSRSSAATSAMPRCRGAARRAVRTSSCTSPPRRTSIGRSRPPAISSRTDVVGTFVLLEAARRAPTLRASSRSRPTRSTAACPTGASRETDELQAAKPVLGEQGGRRPPRIQLLRDLRRARRRHARVEQLRAVPVSREGHSALHHECHSEHSGAALRRRQERPRLAARHRPLPRDRPRHRARNLRRGLQHRRRQRSEERRPHAPHPRPARSARSR